MTHFFKTIFVVVLTVFISEAIAQVEVKNNKYDDLIENVYDYLRDDDIHNAYLELNKLNPNDSNYVHSIKDLTYYLINDTIEGEDRFDEVIRLTQIGIDDENTQEKFTYYFNKASAYYNKEDYNGAIKVYNEALERYPYNYKLYSSMGQAYEELEDYDAAIEMYQQSLNLNPYNAKTHLSLGSLCYRAEKITEALMCFDMYLLLNPDGSNSFNILNAANNIVTTDLIEDKLDISISPDDEAFEDIDALINNHVALRDGYKMKNKIKIAFVKQTHLMLGQIDSYEGNDGFFTKRYVPFFEWINSSGNFDNMTYTMCYSIQNAKYLKLVQKKTKYVKVFLGQSYDKIAEIFEDQEIIEDGVKKSVSFDYSTDGVSSVGVMKGDNKSGVWKYYNKESFYKTSEGKVNATGEYDGSWSTFHENGKVKAEMTYKNDKLNDKYLNYNDKGVLTFDVTYKDDKLDGLYKRYNQYGALEEQKSFKNEKLEGDYTNYYETGEDYPKFELSYKEGKLDGDVVKYFASGQIQRSVKIEAGKLQGVETEYFLNGAVSSEVSYLDGKINGSHKEYYPDGKVYIEGQAEEGSRTGTWKYYHHNGQLREEETYQNGKIQGENLNYDIDGILHYKYVFKKGDLYEYAFYDKEGNVLFSDDKSRGKLEYHGCYPNGNVELEGTYSLDGGKIDEWSYYSENGVLENNITFFENQRDKTYYSYFPNGEPNVDSYYDKGTKIDSYQRKDINGKVIEQGWYDEGELYGIWYNDYSEGGRSNELYYHLGEKNGLQKHYLQDGKIDRIDNYNHGKIKTRDVYDDKGVFETIVWPREENGLVEYHYFENNKVQTRINLKHGVYNGEYTLFFPDGTVNVKGNYVNGDRHGIWTYYHENGKISGEYTYVLGNLNGDKISYHDNGKVKEERFYILGQVHGLDNDYNEEGVLTSSSMYEYGSLHGTRKFYSETGKLQLIRYYNNGYLIGYSYLGKDGKEIEMIPIENETVKIVAYFDNGKVSRELEIVKGVFSNEYKTYYYNGQLEDISTYLNGDSEGESLNYTENGTLIGKQNYHLGYKTGLNVEYHANGKKKLETNYMRGNKHGIEIEYDKNGKQIKKVMYFNDEIVNE